MREMKDSGVEWIGEIPKGWKVQRLKAVLCERNELNNPVKTDFILSLTNDRGVIPYTEKGDVGNKSKDDLTGYKLAYPDDIVLNSMNVIIGSVDLSRYFGCVSPVYYMLYKRLKQDEIKYYNYLFQTKELQNRLKGYGNGIMEIRMRIQMSKLNTVLLPVPSSDEQAKIASYLDSKCFQIDTIIEKQQTVIEKLKEYKLSLITEAVTKGLNHDVPMKDSGVEWIGDVPEHWKIMRFKSVVAEMSSGISAVTSNESNESNYTGKYVLRTSAVSSGYFKPDEVKSVTEDAIDRLICPVEKGTVIMSRMNTAKMVGASAYIDRDYENLYLPDKLWKIKFTTKAMGKYCWYALNCVPIQSWFACVATGSSDSMQNIALKDFLDTFFVFPSVNEQNQIADFLDRKCSAIDATISKKQALIEKLTAYKKSLIYEVVTGKKEV